MFWAPDADPTSPPKFLIPAVNSAHYPGGASIYVPTMAPVTLYAGVFITILPSLHFFRGHATKSSLPLPPGPPGLPIIGNVHQAPKSHAWLQYYSWGKTYGSVVHLNMFGQPVIVLSTSAAAHDLLARRGGTFSDHPRFVAFLIKD